MSIDEAKEILKLYRPGTADACDPAFTEALELAERDAELKRWFAHHCALYVALRSKFKQISVPEGLKEQIIAERRIHSSTPLWQRLVLAGGALAAIVTIFLQISSHWRPRERHDFAAYRTYMGSFASRGYGMDTNTTDLDAIRVYLAEKNNIADYVLPEGLKKNAQAAGCVATTWQGKNVSMICFQSGQPLPPGHQSDLWLFITEPTIEGAPKANAPVFEKENGLTSASWTVGNRTYVLTTDHDEQLLKRFL